jgi:hypothetical protein
MYNAKIAKEMVAVNKSFCDLVYNTNTLVQNRVQERMEDLMAQSAWLPSEARETYAQWVASWRDGREQVKKMMDDAYAGVQKLFEEPVQPATAKE